MADPTEGETPDAPESDQERNWRKLEAKAKESTERAAQLERELAFHKAGLADLTDKQVKALSAAHDGEFTPDALKATAEELGFARTASGQSSPPVEVDHGTEAAELAALSGSTGVTPETRPTGKPSYEQVSKDAAALAADQDSLVAYLESKGFGDF